MTKLLEAMMPELYEGYAPKTNKKKEPAREMSRDFYGKIPGTNRVVRFVSEEEYLDYIREEEES